MSALDEAEAASAAFKGKIANVGERLGEATGAYSASAALGGAMAGSLRGKSVVVSVVDAAGATKSVKAEVRAEQNGVLRLVAAGGAVFNCGAAHVHEPGDDAAAAADSLAELAFADVIASADRLGYPCLAGMRIAAAGDLKKGDPVLVWTPGILGQLRPGVVVQVGLAVEVEAVGDGGDGGGDDDGGGGGGALRKLLHGTVPWYQAPLVRSCALKAGINSFAVLFALLAYHHVTLFNPPAHHQSLLSNFRRLPGRCQ